MRSSVSSILLPTRPHLVVFRRCLASEFHLPSPVRGLCQNASVRGAAPGSGASRPTRGIFPSLLPVRPSAARTRLGKSDREPDQPHGHLGGTSWRESSRRGL